MINNIIQKINKRNCKKKIHRPLSYDLHQAFKINKEGIFYSNIYSSNNNLISKIISKFSKGLSHTVLILYNENLQKYITENFNETTWRQIKYSLKQYYDETLIIDKIKCLVISSAYSVGMVCCDFSNYQERKFTLRKIEASELKQIAICGKLMSTIGMPYDATGLMFWPIRNISRTIYNVFDSEYGFCSESVYDACKYVNIDIAGVDDPSPYEIEKYNAFPLIEVKRS